MTATPKSIAASNADPSAEALVADPVGQALATPSAEPRGEPIADPAAKPRLAELRMLLEAAGLPASDAEVATLAAQYPGLRAATDALYAPPAVRYADPALRFRAEARIVDWA
jgi:hypothetical protein